jgi:vancomycin permeability regulator SanA
MDKKSKGRRKIKIAGWLILLWIVIHSVYITVDGLNDYKGSADIAVVLGNAVNADSSLSPVLRGRVDKAWLLYRQGRVHKVMVSGGKGMKAGKVPEGLAMKRYLVQKGIPPADIIEDNDGESTYLTAKDFRTLNSVQHYSSVIAVSTFYHITRCKYIFRKLGIRNVHGVSSDVFYVNDLFGLPREFLAFYKYLICY